MYQSFQNRPVASEYRHLWPELVFDGHPTYSPDGKKVVTDTYPNRRRIQSIYVVEDNSINVLAKVFSPFKFKDDCRCDLHPRWSTDGSKICFDGCFEGKRAVYCVEVKQ